MSDQEETIPDGYAAIPDAVHTPDGGVSNQSQIASFLVAGIKKGIKDSQGRDITRIYATRSGLYAIYQADDVRIQYADDSDKEAEQRARVVSSVGKSRAEMTALLVGWGQDRRQIYDCKVAMALELALEKKPDEARGMIDEAKAELIRERAAAGRLQYIGFTASWCLPLMTLLVGGEWLIGRPAASDDLLMAGQAGLMGAAFSIALAVRVRSRLIPSGAATRLMAYCGWRLACFPAPFFCCFCHRAWCRSCRLAGGHR